MRSNNAVNTVLPNEITDSSDCCHRVFSELLSGFNDVDLRVDNGVRILVHPESEIFC